MKYFHLLSVIVKFSVSVHQRVIFDQVFAKLKSILYPSKKSFTSFASNSSLVINFSLLIFSVFEATVLLSLQILTLLSSLTVKSSLMFSSFFCFSLWISIKVVGIFHPHFI